MISHDRLKEIRDFDTCVTLEESAEMAGKLISLKPCYQERRYYVSGDDVVEYWADVPVSLFKYIAETEKRIVFISATSN